MSDNNDGCGCGCGTIIILIVGYFVCRELFARLDLLIMLIDK